MTSLDKPAPSLFAAESCGTAWTRPRLRALRPYTGPAPAEHRGPAAATPRGPAAPFPQLEGSLAPSVPPEGAQRPGPYPAARPDPRRLCTPKSRGLRPASHRCGRRGGERLLPFAPTDSPAAARQGNRLPALLFSPFPSVPIKRTAAKPSPAAAASPGPQNVAWGSCRGVHLPLRPTRLGAGAQPAAQPGATRGPSSPCPRCPLTAGGGQCLHRTAAGAGSAARPRPPP